MIEIKNTHVSGIEAAVRGMRNPLNSWEKSDTEIDVHTYYALETKTHSVEIANIGENDLDLMKKLVKAGTDHRKFMRFITVSCDIIAPLYWWSEFDTYKVGTVRNSCSKMHRLMQKSFTTKDFSFDKLPGYKNEVRQFRPSFDEKDEVWKPLNPWYSVSNFGRIRNDGRNRILSGSLHNDGYVFVTIDGKQHPLHRLVASVFCDGFLEGLVVNHKDGNKQNNFADNLEWVTQKENAEHAVRNGLSPRPIGGYNGKFTAEQREEIKALWDAGEKSKREIASIYGVSHSCICDIINDKYKYAEKTNVFEDVARPIVDLLNELRDSYLSCENSSDRKRIWYCIIQLLPESYNQRATVQLNYEVLLNMYHARKNHKLNEWRKFCEWIEQLPWMEVFLKE